MKGAIVGDLVGSRFEWRFFKDGNFDFDFLPRTCRFTDDSLMTIAVAKTLIECKFDPAEISPAVIRNMRLIAHRHPNVGWGARFFQWLFEEENPLPYNSFGNGAGMRVSPVAWVASDEEEVKRLSRAVTEVSHNHPEGIKGAEAIATATYLARTGKGKEAIRARMSDYYPILSDPSFRIDKIRPFYGLEDKKNLVSCQGSVPQAIEAFLESTDFENAVRLAVWLGGDTDTIGCMCGAIAEAYYGIPAEIEAKTIEFLPDDLIEIVRAFDGIRKARTLR